MEQAIGRTKLVAGRIWRGYAQEHEAWSKSKEVVGVRVKRVRSRVMCA